MIDISKKSLKDITFIDLFSGLGGFRIAMESFGGKCLFASEVDKDAQQVYYNNFLDMPKGDITKINETEIPKHDFLCAGFPCQAFSISGKQNGFNDDRGKLFFDIVRIVTYHTPSIIFLENVKNFLTHNNGETINFVKETLVNLGYDVYYKVLNASDYGIAQKRERIYIVCFRKDYNIHNFEFPTPFELTNHLEDYLLTNENLIQNCIVNRTDIYMNNKSDDTYSNKPIRLGIVNKGGQGERIYSTKGVAITLSAYGGGIFAKTGGYLVNGKIRKLHPRECARIMGYPDWYKISPNKAYTQFGNSVVIDILQFIILKIVESIKGVII